MFQLGCQGHHVQVAIGVAQGLADGAAEPFAHPFGQIFRVLHRAAGIHQHFQNGFQVAHADLLAQQQLQHLLHFRAAQNGRHKFFHQRRIVLTHAV